MEKFKAAWFPSPDTFVDTNNLVYQFAGKAEVVGPDLPSSATEAVIAFDDTDLGKTGSAWVRTTGDNGSVDDCAPIDFTVNNLARVRPVQGFGFAWMEHVD